MTDCKSCLSNSGKDRISPGNPVYVGKYWVVEHAYPSALLGWLVIVLNRHCEELHGLTKEEWTELASIQHTLVKSLNMILDCEKEYLACFAEMEGFRHIHFHVIPKAPSFIDEYKGTKAFQYLKMKEEENIAPGKVSEFCERIGKTIEKMLEQA